MASINSEKREKLVEQVLDIKFEQKLTHVDLCEQIGISNPTLVAFLGNSDMNTSAMTIARIERFLKAKKDRRDRDISNDEL